MPGRELRTIPRIARETEFRMGMDEESIQEFSEYIHQCKAVGDRGTKNDKGDFTDDELREKLREFLGK